MVQIFIFIYTKNSKVNALSAEDAKRLHDTLIRDGWVHTATIDPRVYIEYLHNECELKILTKLAP